MIASSGISRYLLLRDHRGGSIRADEGCCRITEVVPKNDSAAYAEPAETKMAGSIELLQSLRALYPF